MSNQQISVSFRVAGNDLKTYLESISKQSEKLSNDAIRNAISQTDKAKEQIKLIDEQIKLVEKRTRIETEASRTILRQQRDQRLNLIPQDIAQRREGIITQVRTGQLSYTTGAEQLKGLQAEEKSKTSEIRNLYREELNTLKESERQIKIQTQLSREQIREAKEAAKYQVTEIKSGNKTLAEVYREVGKNPNPEEKLTLGLIEDQIQQEKKRENRESLRSGKGILGGMLSAQNVAGMIGNLSHLAQTNNGFDAIQPTYSAAGKVIGGILGGVIGGLASGGTAAALGVGAGASLGDAIMGTWGAVEQRGAIMKQDYWKAKFRYASISGGDHTLATTDLSKMGVSAIDYLNLLPEAARRRGSSTKADNTVRDMLFAEKGYGVEANTSYGIIELQRSFKENNRDLSGLIGGILQKGQGSFFKNGDNTFLNEFLNKYTSTTKELLKTSTTVSTGITFDILKQFNSMGGMFNVKDSRSSGIMSSLQDSLSNPGSDNLKALAFGVLRGQNPKAGIFDLRETMQRGLASPSYLKGMLGMIDRMGGDDQQKMNNLSGMFPGVPLAAIRTLFNNRKSLRRFDTSELSGMGISESIMQGKAEGNTSMMEKIQANQTNQFLAGSPIEAVGDAISNAVKESLNGAVIEMKNGTMILTNNPTQIKHNVVKKARDAKHASDVNEFLQNINNVPKF